MVDDFKKRLKRELDKCDKFLKTDFRNTLKQREKILFKSTNPAELKRESAAVVEDTKWKIKMLKRREIIAKKITEIS